MSLPTVDQVAALVRARTRDRFGNELGTFTEDTRPTAAAVETLIASEATIVAMRTGDTAALECPTADQVRAAEAAVIAKRVAAIVEASYRPDELADGRTVADFYQGSMADDLAKLEESATSCRAYVPGDVAGVGDSPAARWSFPPSLPLRW